MSFPRSPDTRGVGSTAVIWWGVKLFVVDGTVHSDAGMASGRVVPALYPFKYGVGEVVAGGPLLRVEQLQLQGAPERFDHRVVVAVADTAHRSENPGRA